MRNVAMVDGEMSVVVVGATEGDFGGASNGGVDVVVVKLDATSGTEVWRYQVRLGTEPRIFGAS